jgi:PAS domain S-box-containing protein
MKGSIHQDDLPRVEELIAEAIRDGGRYTAEFRVRSVEGRYRWVQASGRCHLDASGRPARFPGVLVDIDERKQAEERLRSSELQAQEAKNTLQAIIASLPALVYVKDRQGRMQIANGPTLALIGKPWSQVEGRTDGDFLDDAEQARLVMATDRRLMETGGSEELEEVVGADEVGPRIWLSHKQAFRDHLGTVVGLIGTSVDITGRKRAEQQRQLLLLEMNHRVKNLFALSCGIVRMSTPAAQTPRELADAVTGRLQALSLAHDLILPAVKDNPKAEAVGLEDILRVVLSPHLAPGHDQLTISGAPVSLNANAATTMAMVLHELATNASKYGALSTPKGAIRVSWRADDGEFSMVWLEENGPPVAAPPGRSGFGTRLARQSVAAAFAGAIVFAYDTTGLRVELTGKLSVMLAPAGQTNTGV